MSSKGKVDLTIAKGVAAPPPLESPADNSDDELKKDKGGLSLEDYERSFATREHGDLKTVDAGDTTATVPLSTDEEEGDIVTFAGLDESEIPGAWAVGGDVGGSDRHHERRTNPMEGSHATVPDSNLEEGLAEALPVGEESQPNPDLPVAESFETRVKTRTRQQWNWLLLVSLMLAVAIVAVVTLAVTLRREKNQSSNTNIPLADRDKQRIAVENRILGALQQSDLGSTVRFQDSVHTKTLEWLLYEDPLQLSADAPNLIQRFVVVLFYFTTTEKGPWKACNPPQGPESILCYYLGRNGNGIYEGGGLLYTHQWLPYRELLATRWLTGQHECQWAGLFCNHDKKIQWIYLDEMNITGAIPHEVSLLTDLELISLASNSLEGPLPSAFSQLKKLEYLDLSDCSFTGRIPDDWWTLTNMSLFNLNFNPLDDWTIPTDISRWSNLEVLKLTGAHLTGTVPTDLYQLTGLKFLILNQNAVTGAIPTEIGLLSNLEMYSLTGNTITGSLPSELSQVKQLQELDLLGLGLTGTIPEEFYFGDYVKLNAIILRDNLLSGTIGTDIGRLTTLGYFYLDLNPYISGTIPTEFGLLTQLQKVVLSGTALTGSVPEELCGIRGENFLAIVKADCTPLADDSVPVFCPEGCCTKCCSQETLECDTTGY